MVPTIFIFSLCISAYTCSASPVQDAYPEIILSPDLPSLASLNLTSADIYNIPDPLLTQTAGPPFGIICGPSDDAYTSVNNIIYCINVLLRVGDLPCAAGPNGELATWCMAGDSVVFGQTVTGVPERSACKDVALGARHVINGCTRPDMSVAGFAAPNGNGDMVVGATSVRYPFK